MPLRSKLPERLHRGVMLRNLLTLSVSMLAMVGLVLADDRPVDIGGTPIGPMSQMGPPQTHDGKDNDPCDQCGNSDPIELATGEFKIDRTDLVLPGLNEPLEITFRYRSQRMVNGPWGFGWVPSFEQRLFVRTDGDVIWRVGSGDKIQFNSLGGGAFEPAQSKYHVALTTVTEGYRIDELLTGNVYQFNDKGLLLQIVDRRGNTTTLTWDTDGGAEPVKFPVAGIDYLTAFDYRVKTIEGTLGKKVTFNYYDTPAHKVGRLERIDDDYGRSVIYDYDVRGDLVSVQSPVTTYWDGGGQVTRARTTKYAYTTGNGDPRVNAPESVLDHNLESITDDRDFVQLFNEYDANDRVIAQSAHGGTSTYVYQATPAGDVTIVDEYDGNGYRHQHFFDANRNPTEERTYTAGIHTGLGVFLQTKYGYNGEGEANAITFPRGNGIEREYVDGKLTQLTRLQDMAQPSASDIDWFYTYSSGAPYKPLETVTDPLGNVTTYRYDFEEAASGDLNGDGDMGQSMGNVVRIEFPALTLPDGSTGTTPVWRQLQYNAQGQLTRVIDEEGRITDYAYYQSGHASYGLLQSVTVDPGGEDLTTSFTYDAFGFVDVVTDPRTKVTDYDHNAVGELVRVAGEHGVERLFGYDANGNLVRTETRNLDELGVVQSPEWIVSTCEYDAWNRMTSCTEAVVGSTTRTTSYEYDFLGNVSKVVTPEGRVQTFEYDERGILWRQVRGASTPLASTRERHVDKNGNIVLVIDGRGEDTTIAHDLFDRAYAVTDPVGNRVDMVLSKRDEVLERKLFDAPSSTFMAHTIHDFDELGREIRSIANPTSGSYPQSQTWFVRDRTGLVVGWRSPRDEFTTFEYDDAGRLETVTDPLGNVVQYTLDDNGNPEVVTSIEQLTGGGTESYALETIFDGQNRPTERRRYAQGVPVGSGTPLVTEFGWDTRSQLVKVTDPIGRVMRTIYDLAGRPTSTVEDAAGLAITSTYSYDKDDLLVGLTDPDGKVTGWAHDPLGRVHEIDYAAGGSELFTHDGEDAVKTHTRQDGVVTTLSYWPHGPLQSRTSGALREEFDWAAVGVPREARVLVSGQPQSQVSRTFDGLGRVLTESQDGRVVTYAYDASHNPTGMTWPDTYAVTQGFDALERLESIADSGTVAEWDWSGPGRVANRKTGTGLNLVTTYQWDGFQRLEGLQTSTVHDVAYGYDNLDRRCWKRMEHLTGQPLDVYGYDGGSRLVDVWEDAGAALCAQAPGTWASHFNVIPSPGEDRAQTSLDSGAGPVPTVYNQGSIDALHRYTHVGGTTRLYDGKGNLTSDGELTYAYDVWNRLTAVTEGSTERARYEHDAFGRRTRKIESGLVTEYVYSGARLIAEYEDSGAGPQLARRYVHGVGLDELVALDSVGSRYFAFGDALGSVEVLTDAGGNWAELYRYDAFGVPTVMGPNELELPLNAYNLPESALGNALWFTGARYDRESGHYHMRARQYEPGTGRFVSRDPLGYVDSANAYQYASSSPATFIDPFGLSTQSGPFGGRDPRGPKTKFPEWDGSVPFDRLGEVSAQVAALELGIGATQSALQNGSKIILGTLRLPGEAFVIGVDVLGYAAAARHYAPASPVFQWIADQRASGSGSAAIAWKAARAPFDAVGDKIETGAQAFLEGRYIDAGRDLTDAGIETTELAVGSVGLARAAVSIAGRVGVADSACATAGGTRFGPLNRGPLPDGIASTFRGGSYTAVELTEATEMYRVFGGTAGELGAYWSRTRPAGPLQSQIDLGLNPLWGNTATQYVTIRVPAGTTVYEGAAAAQGGLVGGGNQVVIPNVNPEWIVQ